MDDVTAAPVQQTAEIVKSTVDVNVGYINVLVLVRMERLDETGSFNAFFPVPLDHWSCPRKDSPSGGGTYGGDVTV